MRLGVAKTARAKRDLIAIYRHLGADSLDAARAFLGAAERTFASLAEAPGTGRPFDSPRPTLRTVRVCPVRGFRNYLVFYIVEPQRLIITRVVHGARDLPAIVDA